MALLRRWNLVVVFALCLAPGVARSAAGWEYVPSAVRPLPAPREFRGVWVASVGNIDWPSAPGLSTDDQKKELLAILDRVAELRLNAVILQVRTGCDALYASSYEPWSEYLTGQMGQAPKPFYDPLLFAVEEAHRRGLELHAWFNPFRARHSSARSPVSAQHISRTHPNLAQRYGSLLWLDPGESAVQDHALKVIMDVVRRYDIDGVHLDDYFYPYPERTAEGKWLDFPDNASWDRYVRSGGKLQRKEWRRQNVDYFIQRFYRAIKVEKPWVKVGISPFGIWRPGHPAPIRGLDAYDWLYADARKWLQEGWLDYCAPQLYWPMEPKETSFQTLLQWWAEQNTKKRHLWPGSSINNIGPTRPPAEIVRQIDLTRRTPGVGGNIWWSFKALRRNQAGIANLFSREIYGQQALVPASAWLDKVPPLQPRLVVSAAEPVTAHWETAGSERAWLWLLQMRTGGRWTTEVLPGSQTSRRFAREIPDVIAVAPVDRVGNIGPARVLEKKAKRPAEQP